MVLANSCQMERCHSFFAVPFLKWQSVKQDQDIIAVLCTMQKRVTAIRLHPFWVWQQPNSADVSRLITDGVMLGIGGAPGVTLGTVKSVCTHYIYKISLLFNLNMSSFYNRYQGLIDSYWVSPYMKLPVEILETTTSLKSQLISPIKTDKINVWQQGWIITQYFSICLKCHHFEAYMWLFHTVRCQNTGKGPAFVSSW